MMVKVLQEEPHLETEDSGFRLLQESNDSQNKSFLLTK